MRCTDKQPRGALKKRTLLAVVTALAFLLTGCGQPQYDMRYTADSEVSSFRIVSLGAEQRTAEAFAAGLCVVGSDIASEDVDMSNAVGAGLFDVNRQKTLYAKNVHERLYPASLTKVMTALVAMENGTNDMRLTASANVKITESGAQLAGIKEGDQMTLDQALHLLLINSANDVAVMIAEGIAGSVDGFTDMMNQKALSLGATNTHFANPHGLSDEEHYTTVYDMYLIMNEAVKYALFNEIIHMDSYNTVYTDRNGNSKDITVKNTNRYIQGDFQPPSGITVLGGKTGTTSAAGSCLVLISRDSSGNPYISVIMRADSSDFLYSQMTDLLEEINK
ncbi:D-alanyl-D-alanine carboxypeptidase DacB [Lachnospiraceae bacterium]|nr:D-alanyl-D-alanine carboxypeptidase DacB [Lachnospiraceae bacterium]